MLRKVSFPGEDRVGKRGSENIGSMLGKVTLARSVPSWASDPCPLPMHEGDPLIAFVGKRPLPMHEGDPLIWDGLPRPRTHDDPAIGDFRSQMSSMHVGILLG